MFQEAPGIDVVPAYHATTRNGRTVPFIISLLLIDQNNQSRLPPSVVRSIDRTLEITGREGVATASVTDKLSEQKMEMFLERGMCMDKAIVLFRCHSPEVAERLMAYLHSRYQIRLVQEGQDISEK